jgi:hypothetical protein
MKKSELRQLIKEEILNITENNIKRNIVITKNDEEIFEEFFEEFNLNYISKKIVPKPKEMFGMMKDAIQFDFGDKIDKVVNYLNNTDLNYILV